MSDRLITRLFETLACLRCHLGRALRSQSSPTAAAAARADRVALVAEVRWLAPPNCPNARSR